MEVLHRRRRATVEEIRAEIPAPPGPSSVRKLLEILMARGHVVREYEQPRFLYFPASRPEEASRSALKNVVRTFFGGSPGATIAALLDISDSELSDADFDRLEKLLKNSRRGGKKR